MHDIRPDPRLRERGCCVTEDMQISLLETDRLQVGARNKAVCHCLSSSSSLLSVEKDFDPFAGV